MHTLKRRKSRFRSAQAAWTDIARRTGKTARSVVRTKHTARFWAWEVR